VAGTATLQSSTWHCKLQGLLPIMADINQFVTWQHKLVHCCQWEVFSTMSQHRYSCDETQYSFERLGRCRTRGVSGVTVGLAAPDLILQLVVASVQYC
jgi:hypothetical protein